MTHRAVSRRYDALAAWYDVIAIEWFVYQAARRDAVELLRLRRGDTVVDLGCGTGASLGLLRTAVGPNGTVIGIDASAGMLRRARGRIKRQGWDNVVLIQADARRLSADHLPAGITPDAALCALSLSVIPHPTATLDALARVLRPAGRIAVMDAGLPPKPSTPGARLCARLLQPIWAAVFRLAAADPSAHPWAHLASVAPDDMQERRHHLGYVRVAAGTIPTSPQE